ncbi:unnamed protein product [Rotaria socialis]|uniref:phosphatidate phosphatase n=1 Tax=Rotaria socialis TaxID=392032 RepID=A0A821C0N2_9BILA|nr:unnamed protein product [Rotaria socialis]CAF4600318.1 unnamed protein product [Rotaria socialis]
MTSITRKVISKLTTVYRNINPSTLNGAIDIIVVQQEDGTLRCTPFHVRFGKLGVLQSLQNKVYITINDIPVEDLYMQLGEAGEAVFVEEDTSTSAVTQPARQLEPSNNNTCVDLDNVTSFPSETDSHSHLSNSDSTPQTISQKADEKDPIEFFYPSSETYVYEEESKPVINIDVVHSDTFLTTRRRPRRRLFTRADQSSKQASEDDDQDVYDQFSSLKRRSRARKRESIPTTTNNDTDSITSTNTNEKFRRSVKLLRKRSASENDLQLFQFDPELSAFINESNCFKSIDNRPKTLDLNRQSTIEEYSSIADKDNVDNKPARNLSNPIVIEQIFESAQTIDETDTLTSSILSKSAPLDTLSTNTLRISQSDDPVEDFYSHEGYSATSSYESASSPRPTSPKSDTEYELDKSSQQSSNTGWRWKWGELPEQRQSVFRYLWPASKKTPPKEGIYLDDITSNRCVDRSLYLPQMDYHQHHQRTTNDDDQESGTGNSIPQSPFREHEATCLLGDAQLSLCGNINKQSLITDEVFYANLVSFETFLNNPSIVSDPNLVVRINGKYYNWNVASALIVSTSIYHKPLPNEVVEQLQEKHMAQEKPRSTGGGWWLPFYGKKSDMKVETPKVTTPITATDAIAAAAKSEVVPTALTPQDSNGNNTSSKNSKTDNDSEQEDSEVRKLTAKIEQEKQQQQQQQPRLPSTHSSHQTALKKTMILSSDELKRLNLKLGKNKVEFSVTTSIQGTTTVDANIFLFDHMTKFVISDIDGTITKSDVLGHIIPLVGGDWSHDGIAEFFNAIQENGYQFIYLSARAIGQSQITRNFLKNVKQYDRELPIGPLLISPDTLMTALYREVIEKKPEYFKIECLKNIASLFPAKNPFYAGFGNRINDQWAYTAVGIPVTRIYTINPRGEVVRQELSETLLTSYKNLHEIVDLLFPPMDSFSASETYSGYTYWHSGPSIDLFKDEMCTDLQEIAKKQKAAKSNSKNKGSTATTPTSSTIQKTAPTATTVKSNGNKSLAAVQSIDYSVKRA